MMKKIAYFVAVLVLCLSMVTPAFAAAGDFTPSVSYKDNPDIVEVTKLLLRFGLKPNAVYGEEKDNFMFLLQ